MFISITYMFRAAMCPSSGELIVSIRRLYMSLCKEVNNLKKKTVSYTLE